VIATDVRALAINSDGDIFALISAAAFIARPTTASWTQINNALSCPFVWSLAINADGELFVGTAGLRDGVYRSIDNGDHWTLVNNGLTSTDIAAVAINPRGDIFAGTYSQFGVGAASFARSIMVRRGRRRTMVSPPWM
jgi:hypothetical protein